MPVQFNHTIVFVRDQDRSARFLTDLFGLPEPARFGPFTVVSLANGVSLDFLSTTERLISIHYAFLVTEEEFDQIFGRIQEQGLPHWADPFHSRPNEINHNDGGRGVYFDDLDGHNLEIITRPYGSGS